MTMLVTGASGFVGRHLCADAVRQGLEVRGAVHRDDAILLPGVERIVVENMAAPVAWERAVADVTSIVHLAARVHVMKECFPDPLAEFRAVNVEGTRGLVRAAAAAGVERFVFVSSVKVHGDGRPEPYRPDDPLQPQDPYARSKAEAEAAVWSDGVGMVRVVVRPPLVYGPGVGGNFRRLLRWTDLAARWPLPLGGIPNRRSFVFVGNLSDALLHLATASDGALIAGNWLVSDGDDLSTSDLVTRLGRAAGRPVRLVPCPRALLRAAGRVTGRGAEVDRLLGSLTVDLTGLRATGWSPPYTVDDGLCETMSWWRQARADAA
jgi:nucleoside-diphosphate-sugar epimerase